MAKREHVELVKRGTAAIAEWRRDHPRERLDISGADLSDAKLSLADLSLADLSLADLIRADLSGAHLSGAILREANLGDDHLSEVGLSGANLTFANLSEADLSEANLSWANLSGADLWRAKLIAADLGGANLSWANLEETDLSHAVCCLTAFADCDLSWVRGLDTVRHTKPSSIGVDTLAQTLQGAGGQFTPDQRVFFESAGVPKTLLDYLPDLLESAPIQFFSCFVSYGAQDEAFAQRLYDDLRNRGIRCYKYDEDAIIGRGVWDNISRAITLHQKTIVVCSESSLQRPGVLREIERALQKEEQLQKEKAERGGTDMDTDVLVPVRLDDYVLRSWEHPRKADVVKKHVGDFHDWQDEAKYKKAFSQLLQALDPRSKLGLSRLI